MLASGKGHAQDQVLAQQLLEKNPENILAEQNLEQRSLQEKEDKQRCRRLRWLGHVFRMNPSRYPKGIVALDTTQKENAWEAQNHLAQDSRG